MILERQEKGLLVLGGPPLVDGGIVLPEFAHLCALPSSPRLGSRSWRADQPWEVNAGAGGDGLAVALEGEASRQFIGDELVIERSLERLLQTSTSAAASHAKSSANPVRRHACAR
jgi:hypothetical protein